MFLTEAAAYGIRSGLVLGLCTRNPPSYAMMALNCAAPTLDRWSAEHRLLIAGQALILGKVLSRSVREFLNEQELLFPAPPMQLNVREREILTLAASGKTSKEIAETIGIAKITVDMLVGTILSKMGALNRNQAIAKAIANKLIRVVDDVHAEYKSAKIHAVRGAPRFKSLRQVNRTAEDVQQFLLVAWHSRLGNQPIAVDTPRRQFRAGHFIRAIACGSAS